MFTVNRHIQMFKWTSGCPKFCDLHIYSWQNYIFLDLKSLLDQTIVVSFQTMRTEILDARFFLHLLRNTNKIHVLRNTPENKHKYKQTLIYTLYVEWSKLEIVLYTHFLRSWPTKLIGLSCTALFRPLCRVLLSLPIVSLPKWRN